jgi:hypothetical protein
MGFWIVDTAGIGSLIVFLAAGPVLVAYILMARWIAAAPRASQAHARDMGGGDER